MVVVTAQPTGGTYTTTVHPISDNFLILSIVLTVICAIGGCWYSLCCSVPAIIFAVSVCITLHFFSYFFSSLIIFRQEMLKHVVICKEPRQRNTWLWGAILLHVFGGLWF